MSETIEMQLGVLRLLVEHLEAQRADIHVCTVCGADEGYCDPDCLLRVARKWLS